MYGRAAQKNDARKDSGLKKKEILLSPNSFLIFGSSHLIFISFNSTYQR